MIETRRNVVIRDFAIFQLKLLLDAGKDFVLSMLSIGALVIDLLAGGGKRPRVFYSVMKAAEKFDLWLNLSGAISRLEQEGVEEKGLFGASEAGSDNLIGKIEGVVRREADKRSKKKRGFEAYDDFDLDDFDDELGN